MPDLLPATMQSSLFYAPGEVAYGELPVPELSPGELLVAVDTALTCGTDVKCYRRGHPVLLKHLPSPFGHEFAGTVAAVGAGVTRFQPGDRVVSANSAPCYECFYCQKKQFNLCASLDLLNGAYADFIRIPARIALHNTYPLPANLSFEAAAFCEPLAVALRGVAMSGVQPGDRVLVYGIGPIGLLLVRAAKLVGAHVTALGRSALKRDLALRFGQADAVVDVSRLDLSDAGTRAALLSEHTPEGRGFDVVIEAVGRPETWEQSLGLVRRGGVVNWFAGCPAGSTVSIDTRRVHYDEITLLSLFHHTPEYFQQALGLLAGGQIDPAPLISDVLPMARFEAALQRVEAGEAVKIALKNQR